MVTEQELLDREDRLLRDGMAALGGRLSGWVAGLLPLHVHTVELRSGWPPDTIAARAAEGLGPGSAVDRLAPDGTLVVQAVTGSGTGYLNPAVVTVRILPAEDGGCLLRIRAAAKEGLVRQRSAAGAAERVAAMLTGRP